MQKLLQLRQFSLTGLLLFLFLILPIGGFAATIRKPLNTLSLEMYLALDDGTGSETAADSSGNSHTGTLIDMDSATDWVNGKYNSGLVFDGTGEYINVPDNANLDFDTSESFTFTMWVKTGATSGYLISKVANDITNYFAMSIASGKINLNLFDSVNFIDINGTKAINDNNWHHVTFIRDVGEDTIKVVTDCEDYESKTDTTTATLANNGDLIIGGFFSFGSISSTFNGTIDDVRLYRRALSTTEAATLCTRGETTIKSINHKPSLALYLPFEDGSGTEATDFSGNSAHGTFSNGPTWVSDNQGVRGSSVYFASSTNIVTVPSANLPTFGGELTVCAAIKTSDPTPTDLRAIVNKFDNFPYGSLQFNLNLEPDGRIRFWVSGNGANASTFAYSTASIEANKAHHACGVYNDAANSIQVFLDGVGGTITSWSLGTTIFNGSEPLRIGDFVEPYFSFQGAIDDVRIYTQSLTQAEIQKLSDSGIAKLRRVSEEGLVFNINFEDGAGTQTTDFSGNNNTGTLSAGMDPATDWVDGISGKALDFDEIDDYVIIDKTAENEITGDQITVAAWINFDSTNTGGIISKMISTGAGQFGLWYYNTNKRLRFLLDIGTFVAIENTNTLQEGVWTHVAGTYDGANMRLYINGELVTGPTAQTGNLDASELDILIGSIEETKNPFDGRIDNARVYRRALSDSEIYTLYQLKM